MFDNETIVSYIYNSNRLDGVSVTEDQTRAILQGSLTQEMIKGDDGREFEREVVSGHDRALRGMFTMSQDAAPLALNSICNLHKALMGELLLSAGEFRECILKYKGLLIASPPQHLNERVEWLVNLTNSGLERAQDVHKFSWRVHHEFITLHPFIEGNGRIARLLLNLVRLRRGLDLSIIEFGAREQYSKAIIEFQQQKIRRAQQKASSGGNPTL
jgi:fido (protein-threonine AMPylation protein)